MTFPSPRYPRWLRSLVYQGWLRDGEEKVRRIVPFLHPGARILDVGSGPGSVSQLLGRLGYWVVPLDIRDVGYREHPLIYDGREMPFRDGAFDVALVLTVLHHTRHPEKVLREASRVAPRVMVMEDVHDNAVQGALTRITDSVVNLEFRNHPHENRTDAGWQHTFQSLGLTLQHVEFRRVAGIFKQVLYVLKS